MAIVNTGILKSPLNWLPVFLMLLIPGYGGHFIFTAAGLEPSRRSQQ